MGGSPSPDPHKSKKRAASLQSAYVTSKENYSLLEVV